MQSVWLKKFKCRVYTGAAKSDSRKTIAKYKGTIKSGIVDEGVNYKVVWVWLRRIFT